MSRSNRSPRTRTRVHKDKRGDLYLASTEIEIMEALEETQEQVEEELSIRFGMNKTCRSCDD